MATSGLRNRQPWVDDKEKEQTLKKNDQEVKITEEAVAAQQLLIVNITTPGRAKNRRAEIQEKTSTEVPF